jgi:hypothetical protein
VKLAIELISVDPKDRLTAKDTIIALKAISRLRIQNEYESSKKEDLSDFKKLSNECQIMVFSFLDLVDILNIMTLNKAMNATFNNEKLWKYFCENTNFGKNVMLFSDYSEKKTLKSFKERIMAYLEDKNKSERRRVKQFIGRNITSEM